MDNKPTVISGKCFNDERGSVTFNNDFNAGAIKRIYFVENNSLHFKRGWQGHKVEQRWFTAVKGEFLLTLIQVDDWINPSKDLPKLEFTLHAQTMNVLHVPSGYVTCIQALEEGSKLMAMSDYCLGEVQDELRFDIDYFTH